MPTTEYLRRDEAAKFLGMSKSTGSADSADALTAAVAEAWPSWAATESTWTGSGTDLLVARMPPDATVVGLWWD
ncbi:MAG: hypothetical protein JWR70_2787 [Modestobacter sp.]|jgi:hypothetical protein|nr:hypothetical protein [Modestobacter sp.]